MNVVLGLGICSFAQIAEIKWATVCDSLRSFRTNEHLWAQVAHDKRATVSKLLRSLMTKEQPWVILSGGSWYIKEQMSELLIFLRQSHIHSFAHKNERFAEKIWFKSYFLVRFLYVFCKFFKNTSDSLILSFLMSDVSELLRSLTKNEWCEQIAQVAHQKLATMSKPLRWLTKNERISVLHVFLSESLICSFFRKKRAIRSENRWANYQPWEMG